MRDIPAQYLYEDEESVYLSQTETFEEMEVKKIYFDPNVLKYLEAGAQVKVRVKEDDGSPVLVTCQKALCTVRKIIVPGDQSANKTSLVELSSGARLSVPSFIEEGNQIMIDVASNSYSARL